MLPFGGGLPVPNLISLTHASLKDDEARHGDIEDDVPLINDLVDRYPLFHPTNYYDVEDRYYIENVGDEKYQMENQYRIRSHRRRDNGAVLAGEPER